MDKGISLLMLNTLFNTSQSFQGFHLSVTLFPQPSFSQTAAHQHHSDLKQNTHTCNTHELWSMHGLQQQLNMARGVIK